MPSSSKAQQRLFGAVYNYQKGGETSSKKIKDIAKNIDPEEARAFAKTKHKGLPEKKKKSKRKTFQEWVEENHPEFFEVSTTTADVALFYNRVPSSPIRRQPVVDQGVPLEDQQTKKKKEKKKI